MMSINKVAVEMIEVGSSTVAKVGHDGSDLYVTFHNGRTYCYQGVPHHHLQCLLNTQSVGKYLNEHIKMQYPHIEVIAQPVEQDDPEFGEIVCPVKIIGELKRATPRSAGFDLIAGIFTTIPAGGRAMVQTGVQIAMPDHCCALVVPRSGLALKQGLTVLNGPGLIDPDYRGGIGVILHNITGGDYNVMAGERVAQLLFVPYLIPQFIQVDELDETERGGNGFGSTGK